MTFIKIIHCELSIIIVYQMKVFQSENVDPSYILICHLKIMFQTLNFCL